MIRPPTNSHGVGSVPLASVGFAVHRPPASQSKGQLELGGGGLGYTVYRRGCTAQQPRYTAHVHSPEASVSAAPEPFELWVAVSLKSPVHIRLRALRCPFYSESRSALEVFSSPLSQNRAT